MSRLKQELLSEAELSDKITSVAKVTFGALISAILKHDDKAINVSNMKDYEQDLGVKVNPTLTKYVEIATQKGFLNEDGTVADKYADTTEENDVDAAVAVQGKISDSLNAKEKIFRVPQVTNNNLFAKQVNKLLNIMTGQAKKSGIKNSLMLTGDPGVGKTSFIRNFSKLLGIPLIPVEAPHITEEHIINIPFMIITGDKVKKDNAVIETAGKANLTDDGQKFDIVQAESNLVTAIKRIKNKKLKDEQYFASIAGNEQLDDLYDQFEDLIDEARDQYHCILFLDEYYRNDNMKIRNILRNILNGRIGNDKIPKGTFIVYASNLDDDGLDEIPLNNDFAEMEFKSPDKEQWFDYILKKYETDEDKDHPSIKLNHKVYNKFYDTMKQSDLSFDDLNSEVRSSPRRWEQLLLYVNANIPVANVREAKILMANVETNFRNYLDGGISSLYPKFKNMMIELIKETSGVDFDGSTHPATEWKDILQQQLETKIKMDGQTSETDKEARKYVPVVSGEPGIGKTAHMETVANNLGLHFLHIDVATLNRESTTGMPLADKARDEDGKIIYDQNGNPVMRTKFSLPELLDLIKKKMAEAIKEDEEFPEEKRKKGQGRYKFLLLFDELTRADAQVFNSIRKLLLEKSFNEEYDLPAEIMVVGALNPTDEGVEGLTKHTRDVVDVIAARASWSKTESYLLSEERPNGLEELLGFDCNAATVGAVKLVLSQYQTRDTDIVKDERLFNIQPDTDLIYISPREITDIVAMTNNAIINKLTKVGIGFNAGGAKVEKTKMTKEEKIALRMKQKSDKSAGITVDNAATKGKFVLGERYSEEDFDAFIDAIIMEFRNEFADKFSFTCKKQGIENPSNILSIITSFISSNGQIRDQYEGIKDDQMGGIKPLNEIFDAYFDNPDELLKTTDFQIYFAANITAPQKMVQEITDFVTDKMTEIQQQDLSGEDTYTNAAGEERTRPKIITEKFRLYTAYMKFMRVILTILTSKAEYVNQVKEAQRTGQYLGNIHVSLQTIAMDFLKNSGLRDWFSKPDIRDPKQFATGQEITKDVREMLTSVGLIKPKA